MQTPATLNGLRFLELVAQTGDTNLIAILKEPNLNLPFPVILYRPKSRCYKQGQVVPFFFALNLPHYKIKTFDRLPTSNIGVIVNFLKERMNLRDDVFCWNLGVLLIVLYLTYTHQKPLPNPIPLFVAVKEAVKNDDHEFVSAVLDLIEVMRGDSKKSLGKDLYPLLSLTCTFYNFNLRGDQVIYRHEGYISKLVKVLRLVSERKYLGVEILPRVQPRTPVRIPFAEL